MKDNFWKRVKQFFGCGEAKAPHEVIPNFLEWEEFDLIITKINGYTKHLYFKGVVDNKLVFSTDRNLGHTKVPVYLEFTSEQYLRLPDNENRRLEERLEKRKINRLNSALSQDSYNEFMKIYKEQTKALEESYYKRQLG